VHRRSFSEARSARRLQRRCRRAGVGRHGTGGSQVKSSGPPLVVCGYVSRLVSEVWTPGTPTMRGHIGGSSYWCLEETLRNENRNGKRRCSISMMDPRRVRRGNCCREAEQRKCLEGIKKLSYRGQLSGKGKRVHDEGQPGECDGFELTPPLREAQMATEHAAWAGRRAGCGVRVGRGDEERTREGQGDGISHV
jgi:hypothetical protein